MIKIKYNNSDTFEEVSFCRIGNLVTITPTIPNISGFTTWRLDGKTQLGDFLDFTTVYKVDSDSVTYSNDGSVYEEPKKIEIELSKEEFIDTKTKEDEIARLKKELADTDYEAIKYSEGWFSDEEYAPIKAHRESIRKQIRELE